MARDANGDPPRHLVISSPRYPTMQFLRQLDGLWWLFLTLVPFLLCERFLHRQIQTLFLLLTRREKVSLVIFSLLFFPGVFLHETSHYLTARLLRVRTGRFSLTPQTTAEGRLQLGYVETESTGFFRDALIGIAPLFLGGAFVAYAGLQRLHVLTLWEQFASWDLILPALTDFYLQPDFWLWFYLIFAVSSTMLPSASDRKAWLPVGGIVIGLVVVSILAGAGPWLKSNLLPSLNDLFRGLSLILAISLAVHVVVLLPVWGLTALVSRLTGLKVVQ
ncbi:MAG: hypothetical protein U9O54_05945 [Chloroflexota bacterium]|nr:hypothetical protein [Chloroflexota bacterium]